MKQGAWLGLASTDEARMVPANLSHDLLLAGDDVLFEVSRPHSESGALTASAECLRPDGAKVTASTKIIGVKGVLPMSIATLAPGLYRFSWTLTSADGRNLVSGEREVSVVPFANDRGLAARALRGLSTSAESVAATLPATANALLREKAVLATAADETAALQDTAAGGGPLREEEALAATARLNRSAERLARVAAAAQEAASVGPTASLVVFEGPVWENRAVDLLVPDQVENPLKIARRSVPGEHEPVALKLFNVTDRELVVRVVFENVPDGVTVTPHEALAVPTGIGEISWDALPKLNDASVLKVPSLETRELWLDVDLASAHPGTMSFKIRLQATNGAGVLDDARSPADVPAPESIVETTIDVLPFQMAPYGAIRLCAWANADGPQAADLLAHGNNVFVLPWGTPLLDDQGRLTGVDYSKPDALLARLRGWDVMLLPSGIPQLHAKLGEAGYATEFGAFLQQHLDHFAQFGFDPDHVALYPVDEPGGNGWNAVNQVVEFGKVVKAIRPGMKLYVDGGGELPMMQALAPYIDVWCPGLHQLPEKSPEMEIQRAPGKQLWSYNCGYPYARPIGTDLRNINIVAEYRAAALFALRYGATGLGFWCYNIGPDAWQRLQIDYMIVYPGAQGPVTSRRWEGVREGIEDARILTALKQRLESKDAPLPGEVQARIRHLFDVTLAEWMDRSYEEMRQGLGRAALDATNNDGAVNALRAEMLDCAAAIGALPK
jgi:hypothetical protein